MIINIAVCYCEIIFFLFFFFAPDGDRVARNTHYTRRNGRDLFFLSPDYISVSEEQVRSKTEWIRDRVFRLANKSNDSTELTRNTTLVLE